MTIERLLLFLITLNEAFSRSAEAETSLSTPLQYSLYEELDVGTTVGNVRQDSNITSRYTEDEALILRFSFRQSLSTSWKLFAIDEFEGVVRTAQVLDRDVLCAGSPSPSPCDLVLDVAVKPLQYFQMIKVVVRLVDVNDNAPRFRESRVAVSVAETSLPGALFPLPAAEDADSGRLGVQEYQLLSDFDCFELKVSDQADGSKDVRLRLAKSVDRETVDYYHAVLLALDGGVPQKSGSISVDVVVLDANDNSPRFENSSYEVSVEENTPASTALVRVQATDPDEGLNGAVTYSFTDQTDLADGATFGVDNTTGVVYLKAGLDYEQVQTVQLTVQCRDRGPNSLPAFARVTVNVLDVNDNPPVISVNVLTPSGRAEVQENSDRGSFVAHVAVKDADSGGAGGGLGCELVDGRDLFRLEPLFAAEYKIVTSVSFDREQQELYSVLVTCSDHGLPPLSSSELIRVFVTDENDHSPVIARALYELEIPENSPPDSVVLAKIEATDEDAGKNRALRYRISPVDPGAPGVLSVNPVTGKVTANVALDYEDRRHFAFVVTVSDQGDEPRTSTASIVLRVRDLNDERPTFDRSVYHFSTRENLPVGTVVGRVSATDRDLSPDFRQIVYGLRDPSDDFEVDRISGEIMNLRRLDREADQIHRVTVAASNRGRPVDFDGTVNVTVTVDDENDNAPVFTFPSAVSKTVQVSGAAAVSGGLPVAQLVAVDADSGANARIRYEILHGNNNEHGMFEVDPESGIVSVSRMPAVTDLRGGGVGGVNRVFRLRVAARDSGNPPLASVADLVVLVNDSAEPNYAAHEGSRGGPFDGVAVVVAATVLGMLLVLGLVVVATVVFLRRRRRRRRSAEEDKASSTADQTRPLSRAARTSCRSLNAAADDASVASSGGGGSSRERGLGPVSASGRRHRVRSSGGSMMLPVQNADSSDRDDDTSMERIPTHWPLRPSQSLRIPKKLDSGLVTDAGLGAVRRPSYQDCYGRDRRASFGRSSAPQQRQHSHRQQQQVPHQQQQQQQQQQQPYCGLCGSATRVFVQHSPPPPRTRSPDHPRQRQESYGQRRSRALRNSSERTPTKSLPQGDMDEDSACSYADSGRGPSEEEDLNQLVLAAIAAAAAASSSSSSSSSSSAATTTTAGAAKDALAMMTSNTTTPSVNYADAAQRRIKR